ncbi:MAG: adenylyl-sulfate kinase [Gemmatimonadales bacterium]
MFHESHTRSILKAVSWRLMGTIVTTGIVFVFTRRVVLSLAVGGIEFFSKIGLFWFHERLWDLLPWGKRRVPPAVIWFTGLPASGKSTVADWVDHQLRRKGLAVERLDGDSIREVFPRTGYTREERDQHLRRIGHLASKLEAHGVFVVASFVSPYEDSRKFIRGICQSFIEVHVSTPLEECERRDPKGLYARARRGEIDNFTGVSDPYEAPAAPDLVIDTSRMAVEDAGAAVLRLLRDRRGGNPR